MRSGNSSELVPQRVDDRRWQRRHEHLGEGRRPKTPLLLPVLVPVQRHRHTPIRAISKALSDMTTAPDGGLILETIVPWAAATRGGLACCETVTRIGRGVSFQPPERRPAGGWVGRGGDVLAAA